MDILKAEIAKKRKELEELRVLVCYVFFCHYKQLMYIFILRYTLQENNKKYFKRSHLISKEQEVHETDKGTNEAAPSNSNQQSEECVTDSSSEHLLSRQEVIRRLRERGEPILLFGESEIEAFKRLRKCEILEPEVNKVK